MENTKFLGIFFRFLLNMSQKGHSFRFFFINLQAKIEECITLRIYRTDASNGN